MRSITGAILLLFAAATVADELIFPMAVWYGGGKVRGGIVERKTLEPQGVWVVRMQNN